jgi:hypothetical protein
VTETPDKATQDNKPPEVPPQAPSSRVPAIMVSLAALAIVGGATANALPNLNLFALPSFNALAWSDFNSLPKFDRPSLPKFSSLSLPSFPNFPNFSWPDFSRFKAAKAPPPRETATVRIPDPIVGAALRDIQLSQKDIVSSEQQNAVVLASLTQSSANQQADLKRISRQLSALSTQVDALQGAMAPLTTSSIPRPKPRARVALTQRKMPPPPVVGPPPLPKPVGPVSVGGAPLNPAPAPSSGSG